MRGRGRAILQYILNALRPLAHLHIGEVVMLDWTVGLQREHAIEHAPCRQHAESRVQQSLPWRVFTHGESSELPVLSVEAFALPTPGDRDNTLTHRARVA